MLFIQDCFLLLSILTCSWAFLLEPPVTERATCQVEPDPASTQLVTGTVVFTQSHHNPDIEIAVNLQGFDSVDPATEGQDKLLHGFHVHTYGNITGGCGSTGGHYNPMNVNHGGPHDPVRHPGDFGNLQQTSDGKISTTFHDHMATLFGPHSIVGRAIVVHANADDLGRGGNAGSLANGNAGARLACCVIGWDTPPDN